MALSTVPNVTLKVAKWPIAICMICLLPGTLMALVTLSMDIARMPNPLFYFAAGACAYALLWQILLKRRFMGSLFSTFEHELTHALFAWLTLHRVTGLKTTWSQGGEMRYQGEGNWLIAIAPYWFPTLCIPFVFLTGIGQFDGALWVAPAFGATFSYHITSTIRETHRQQTDLQKTGFLFAWAFLPSANLLSAGFIIAYAHSGLDTALSFVDLSWQNSLSILRR